MPASACQQQNTHLLKDFTPAAFFVGSQATLRGCLSSIDGGEEKNGGGVATGACGELLYWA